MVSIIYFLFFFKLNEFTVGRASSAQCCVWPAASLRADARAGHTPINRAVVYYPTAVGPCA